MRIRVYVRARAWQVVGDSSMYPMPWVGADVWVPVGEALGDGRSRFQKAQASGTAEPAAACPSRARVARGGGDARGASIF